MNFLLPAIFIYHEFLNTYYEKNCVNHFMHVNNCRYIWYLLYVIIIRNTLASINTTDVISKFKTKLKVNIFYIHQISLLPKIHQCSLWPVTLYYNLLMIKYQKEKYLPYIFFFIYTIQIGKRFRTRSLPTWLCKQ